MNNEVSILLLAFIGIIAGTLSGFMGIGGGIVIVPALIYLAGYSQHMAIGTSLAILLPPVGLAAVLEYYNKGHVDIRSAIVIAIFLFASAWISARFANRVDEVYLKIGFGLFLTFLGLYTVINSLLQFNKG
ncbi:MAG: permease [Lentisphaerae bacterium RIFOXYA12_FULL_48_11]|nr:MAG: permease [Lentisphaerae bacterium RIFOXYA12_FULL_48_11]